MSFEWGAGGLELNGFWLAQVVAKVLAKELAKVLAKALAKVLAQVLAKVLARFVLHFCWRTIQYELSLLFRACAIWRLVPQSLLWCEAPAEGNLRLERSNVPHACPVASMRFKRNWSPLNMLGYIILDEGLHSSSRRLLNTITRKLAELGQAQLRTPTNMYDMF